MSEQEALAKQNEDVTADNVEEAVTGVTSADPTRVEEEVQQAPEELQEVSEEQEVTSDGDVEAQEIEQEEPVSEEPATEEASVQTEEVQAEEETPVAESNGDISFTDYIDNIPQIKRGATVNGVIVRYDDENVFVDVKDKSEGKISKREFENDPEFDLDKAIEEKTPIEVYVKNIRNTDQGKEILLSKARVDFSKHKAVVEEAFNDKTPITVKVVNVVKDGVIAAYGGVDIYIHRTQLDFNVVEDLEPYKGTEMEIMVTQFDPDRKRLRVSGSRRALLNRERKARADELWDSIAVGDIYEGVVRNITDFGCFVDIGGVDGLVHISELSWNRIKHPSEVVAVGDVIQVYVKDFDKERKRISLGYKRYEDDPYHDIEERFPVGGIVHGKVVRMFNFGAFIEIAPGVDALCHISQISSRRLDKPGDVLKEGMEVDARVLDVNNEERKISISIRDVQPLDDFIGEAAEKEEKRQDTREKKKKERLPNSYSDSNNEERPLSDMEKAFAAAKAAQEGNEDVAEEEVTEEVSDAAEDVQTEVEAVEAETEEAVDSVEEEVEAETEVAVEEVNEEAEETTEKVEKTAEEVEEVKNTEE